MILVTANCSGKREEGELIFCKLQIEAAFSKAIAILSHPTFPMRSIQHIEAASAEDLPSPFRKENPSDNAVQSIKSAVRSTMKPSVLV